ncbi:MAG: alpha/beta hydrolase [Xanthomonadaceae bacterium]|jgi:pimeloyl-ACP methyl ester carboxylesterase|nr:alpha/beta hydrolase [Xanthomonadaceae bacterium]
MDMRPWVLVHGAGGGAWEWLVWQRVLAARGAVVHAVDLQPARAGLVATTLEDYAAQVESAVRSAGQPVLVGASLGGLLAAMVAVRCPVAALVLVNPMPPAPSRSGTPIIRGNPEDAIWDAIWDTHHSPQSAPPAPLESAPQNQPIARAARGAPPVAAYTLVLIDLRPRIGRLALPPAGGDPCWR